MSYREGKDVGLTAGPDRPVVWWAWDRWASLPRYVNVVAQSGYEARSLGCTLLKLDSPYTVDVKRAT